MITARQGTAADLPALLALRGDAQQWLHQRGIQQWVTDQTTAITASLHAGTVYMFDNHAGTVGTVTLNGPEPSLWGNTGCNDDALYIYKLIVARRASGCGLGREIIEWCMSQARTRAKESLRLDCWQGNTGLVDYYRRQGFDVIQTVTADPTVYGHEADRALMQRPVDRSTTRRDHVRQVHR